MSFFRKKISSAQQLSFLTERTLLKIKKEIEKCSKYIIEQKQIIDNSEEDNRFSKNITISSAENSIIYFVQRRNSLLITESYIKDFSRELEDHLY